jgi:hypothetical protein
MSQFKFTISIAVAAFCTAAGTFLWAAHTSHSPSERTDLGSSSSTAVNSKYTNDFYGYSVIIPNGYGLATDVMAASNDNEVTSTADFVVVTDLPPAREKLVAAQIQKLDPQRNLVSAQAAITGNDFTISPVIVDLGWDFAKHFAELAVPGTNIPTVEDLVSDTLDDGQGVVHYSIAVIDDPSMRLETVFVPVSSSSQEQKLVTTPIKGFLVQSLDDASFSEPAFTSFYKSFELFR